MWEKVAKLVDEVYDTFVNWEERFFICPECGEPIYEEDWGVELEAYGIPYCPICENEYDV